MFSTGITMFSLLWNLGLAITYILFLPQFVLRFRKNPLLKEAFLQKLGLNFPQFSKETEVIWVHAVSVGEVKAVSKLVEQLKTHYKECTIIVSTTTITGKEEAKRSIKHASAVVFLPIDLSFIIRKVLREINLKLVILVETDFWYHFLREAKKKGAKIVLVNGKLSKKSQKRYSLFPWIAAHLFQWIDLYLLQSKEYATRFYQLGIGQKKVHIMGNLKLDNEPKMLSNEEQKNLKEKLHIKAETKTIIFGSTHLGEEALALDVSEELLMRYRNVKIILVPRHPERFASVKELIKERAFSFYCLSSLSFAKEHERIILVDTMGALLSLYQISDIAIVGGSFIPGVGGHNIIEPLAYKVPVLYGPHMHKQPEFTFLVEKYKAGMQVMPHLLHKEIALLIEDRNKRTLMGSQGGVLVNENRGATEKTLQAISTIFPLKTRLAPYITLEHA